ncbi:protein kinase domain-containing protein [Citrus sinensis]|nr:protein kinase domain-containing protein [Citrus sinensis]
MAKMNIPCGRALLAILFMAKLMSITEANITTDEAALLQVKAHIALDPQNFFERNWNLSATTNTSSSNSVCNWVGVTCGSRHGRVTDLSIPNLGLGGTIPPHVANLSFLVSLNISGNRFHGTLPNELWLMRRLRIIDLSSNRISGNLFDDMCNSLTELESFDVSSNQITGQLPSSLGDCSKLKRLSVSFNELTGRIPQNIGNLTELMELYLNGNNLQGEFPPTIFNVSSLRVIVLANNSLFGSLPVDLCQRLPSLQELNLRDCMTTGRIPKDIGNCTLLNYLGLRDNQLTGEIPHEIGNLQNLKLLDFGANNLTGLIPSIIFNNSNIEVIQLYGNHLSGNLPSSTGINLPNLLRLYLWGNNLSGVIPSSICNASKLTVLELSRNLFSGLVANTFGNCRQLQILNLAYSQLATGSLSQGQSFFSSLTNCRYLRYLAIQTNPWKGILPNSVGNLSKSLEYFYAGSCELGGGIPAEFGNLSNIIALSLYQNQLASTIPTTVGKLQNLQGLDLSYNNIQGSIPSELCQLESLNTLLLQGNALQNQIPTCLANLTSLRALNLSSNRLNSTIPPTFWSLEYILVVDFSLNLLSGCLPQDIGNLKVLTGLYLSGNQLSCSIPSSIGGLKDLTYLAVARNGFQGSIPESIGSLISLEKGEIPSGGPFVNFTEGSFMQNYALCGSLRLQVQACETSSTQQSKSSKLLRYVLPAVATAVVMLALIIIFIRCCTRNKNLPILENDSLSLATWRRISYQELQRLTDGFSESNLIGAGSFGSVYKATLPYGMNVAIKVFNLQLDGAIKSFDAECEVLRRVRHRNLVKIISSCSNHGFKALILEYMPQGSLEKWLYSHKYTLNIQQRLDIMIDVASALEYLHHGHPTPVIHCDLKPSNVLLDDDTVAHLSDFGISKLLDGEDSVTQTMTLATFGYMAPEYGSEGIVSTCGDVYSFGILMIETFTRKMPTDEMFTGETSLKKWVEESLRLAVTEVVDAELLSSEEEEGAEYAAKTKCISSIMSLALKCATDIPEERMKVKDALVDLQKIRTNFLMDVQEF